MKENTNTKVEIKKIVEELGNLNKRLNKQMGEVANEYTSIVKMVVNNKLETEEGKKKENQRARRPNDKSRREGKT